MGGGQTTRRAIINFLLIILFVSQSRTFPGKWRGQSVKLVVDLKRGLRLYSATDRVCVYYYLLLLLLLLLLLHYYYYGFR